MGLLGCLSVCLYCCLHILFCLYILSFCLSHWLLWHLGPLVTEIRRKPAQPHLMSIHMSVRMSVLGFIYQYNFHCFVQKLIWMQICMLFLILYFSMFFSICIFFFILYTFNCLFLSTLYMSVYSADCICQSGFISLFVLLFVCRLSAISYGCLSGYPFVCVFDCSGTLDLWSQRSAGTPTEPKLE